MQVNGIDSLPCSKWVWLADPSDLGSMVLIDGQ